MNEHGNSRQPTITQCASLSEAQKNTVQLLKQAHQEILIDSWQLNHALYSQSNVVTLLKSFCLSNPRNRVKILIHDLDKIRNHGHLLLPLMQHLTSSIEVRCAQTATFQEALVVDRKAFQYVNTSDNYSAHFSTHHPTKSKELSDAFHEHWEQSSRDHRLLSFSL